MSNDKLNFKLLNLLILLVICYLVISTFNWWSGVIERFISIIFPFIVAFAIAYALYPIVRKLVKKGVRKTLAVSFVVVLISSLFIGLIIITIPPIFLLLL